MPYAIITDSCCNLPEDIIDDLQLHILPLTFMVDDQQYRSYIKGEHTDLVKFFDMMRNGKVVTTSLPNLADSEALMRSLASAGSDVLFIGFSSALSGTFQATSLLMRDLEKEFPERKFIAIDSLAASMGQGLLVYEAALLAKQGKSLEEVAAWTEENKLNIAHWFTVDDLMFLFRGGRVSRSSAWAGTLLSIKPVMHVDNEGRLIPLEKVKGRKKSIKGLFEHMRKTVEEPLDDKVVMISHGDCREDADMLAQMIQEAYHPKAILINCLDPVIGAHAGPGTLALFFNATSRD